MSLHFETSFWSRKQSDGVAGPDFTSGLQVLHRKLKQSKYENDEVIGFFKERVVTEEQYATQLGRAKALLANGFAADDGATLKSSFQLLKATNHTQAERHRALVDTLKSNVLAPLVTFHDDYQMAVQASKQAMDAHIKQFDQLVKDADRAKALYHRRCRDADQAEDAAVQRTPASPAVAVEPSQKDENEPNGELEEEMVQVGSQTMTRAAFEQLVREMQADIPQHDYRVPLLGKYTHTSTGENIARWLQQKIPQCKDSPAMTELIAQQLITPFQVLRLVGQRGNKFVASPHAYYQWRALVQAENNENASTTAASNTGLLSMFDRTTANNGIQEEPHKKARADAERADEAYRSAIKRLDQMRTTVEEAMFTHFAELEQIETRRIHVIKKSFTEYTSSLSSLLPIDKEMIEEMLANQESLKPEQDIQYIVQHYFQGSFAPRAILYENYYHGIAHDQIFGVPLADLAKLGDDPVPMFVTRVLEAIEQGSEGMEKEAKMKLWSTPVPLQKVHALRADVNTTSERISKEMLLEQEPGLLAALLRLFLMELPQCLFTQDLYTPLHAVYATGKEADTQARLVSVANLVALLPAAHFETLQAIAKHIQRFMQSTDPDEATKQAICQALGNVIVQAPTPTLTTQASKVPSMLLMDLIEQYDSIYTDATQKAHEDSEKRQQQRLVAAAAARDASLDGGDRRRNSSRFLSFIRTSSDEPLEPPSASSSSNQPTSPATKWNFNVFRSNSLDKTRSPLTPTHSHTPASQQPAAKSHHTTFTPSSIVNDSPPLSPTATPSITTTDTATTTATTATAASTTTATEPPAAVAPLPPPKTDAMDNNNNANVMFDIAALTKKAKAKDPDATFDQLLDEVDENDLDPFFDDD